MNREVFSESEKRFLITQILKASSVPLERIFQLFVEYNEEPYWENIYLPAGRTLQECKAAFDLIRSTTSPFATPNSPGFSRAPFYKRKVGIGNYESSSVVSLESKRRLSGIRGQDMGGQQLILPKPSPTDSATSGSENMFGQQLILPKPVSMDSVTSLPELMHGHQHILPKPSPISDSGPSIPEVTVKKRGRPPKAEVERRQQALARGELMNNQSFVTQIRHGGPAENTGVSSSLSYAMSVPLDIRSQASSSTPKTGTTSKRSGPIRQPGEGRFSLNDFIKSSPDRLLSSKTSKTALKTSLAGPEPPTTKTSAKISSKVTARPKSIVDDTQPIETQNSEKSSSEPSQKPSEENPKPS